MGGNGFHSVIEEYAFSMSISGILGPQMRCYARKTINRIGILKSGRHSPRKWGMLNDGI